MDKTSILKQLLALYQQLLAAVQNKPTPDPVVAPVVVPNPSIVPTPSSNAQIFVAECKALLGQPLWKGTGVDPVVACAISVNVAHEKAFGFQIGGGASTALLYQALLVSPYFKLTTVYKPGNVIISPTGMGKDPADFPNGHVGVVCNFGICANYSPTGLWSEIYKTYNDWEKQFTEIEKYPIFMFERI